MKANIQEVAKQAGVSTATVSRTFKHPEVVTEKTRNKVLKTAENLDFSISRSASVFQANQTYRVALLTNDQSSTWFNAHIYEGLDSVFNQAGYDISFNRITSKEKRKEFFEKLPIRRNVDAVIVTSFNITNNEIPRLHSMNVPVVGISTIPQDAFTLSVAIDDKKSMELATKHLIKLGHRDIAFIGFSETSKSGEKLHFTASQRINGFIEGCNKANIEPKIIRVTKDGNAADSSLTQLFALKHMPTALCCQQDSLAIPLMVKLQQFGYRIPSDISIIGFDDIDLAGPTGLTTVHQDPSKMGALIARRTLQLIQGKKVMPSHEIVETPIIFRNSTAPVRQRNLEPETE